MPKLHGKVALVTGGSSGIGLATAKRFVDEGAFIYITESRQTELDKAALLICRSVAAADTNVMDRKRYSAIHAFKANAKG